ncbi:MAG: TonB-dependent receptor domain-containing protein [Cyclobacteriaceae bacterium]
MYKITLLLLTLFSTSSLMAQALLRGQLFDADTNVPLEYATVSVLQGPDSTLVGGGLTDASGNFNLSLSPGTYTVRLQFVSYEKMQIEDVEVGSNPRDLGRLMIKPATALLSELVVEGQREQMTLELDKRVFDVTQDLANTGRNAADILDNIPSVTVDVDGNVSLRGSQNVRILVDGKPSGLIGIGNTDGLRTLQGDVIERVEVVTNPSARYDAEGSAGIINIVLKKKKNSGLNGSFTTNVGTPENYGASVNLNYRQNWVNFFVNYGVNYRRTPGSGSRNQLFYNSDSISASLIENERVRGGLSHNIRVGTDFIINEFNTITASLLYNVADQNNVTDTWYRDFNLQNELFRRTLRTDNEYEDERNQEYELYYKRTFARKGRELSATMQYRESNEVEDATQVERDGMQEMLPNLFQRSLNDENELQWFFQADYVHPFAEKAKFEIGYRSTLRDIDTRFLVEEQEESGDWFTLDNFSNTFNYDENIHAAYAILSNKSGKWSYQGGLRLESTDIITHLIETDERYDKNYLNFFPSAFLTYELKKGSSLQGSYSRRINRPGFRSLNPFFSFSDPRNLRTGNPDLDPEFTDSYELGYLYNFKSGNFYFGGFYRHTDDVVVRFVRTLDEGRTLTRPENLGIENSFGFEFNAARDLYSWWQLNANLNIFRSITDGELDGQNFDADTYALSSRFTSKWDIPNLFELQLTGFYRAPQRNPQGKTLAFYSFDLGASREILNKKGTLSFNVRDILNSRRFRAETMAENFFQVNEFQWAQRQLTLSFSYRLNQVKRSQRGGQRGGGGGDYGGGNDSEF